MKPHIPEDYIGDPELALRLLEEGNARFVANRLLEKDHGLVRNRISAGQHPFAAVVCCADSRVSPEIFFDQRLGDLFVVRNAGNVVDATVLGSVEYAVEHLGVRLVAVVGHSGCGAVTAACSGGSHTGHLGDILAVIEPSAAPDRPVADVARRHAERMAQRLRKNAPICALGAQIKSAYYDIASGVVSWLD